LKEVVPPLEDGRKTHFHQQHWVSLPKKLKLKKKKNNDHGMDVA
jgi:hypothetical protein